MDNQDFGSRLKRNGFSKESSWESVISLTNNFIEEIKTVVRVIAEFWNQKN